MKGKSLFKESIVDTSKILLAASTSSLVTTVLNFILAMLSLSLMIASSCLTVIGMCFLFCLFSSYTFCLWPT